MSSVFIIPSLTTLTIRNYAIRAAVLLTGRMRQQFAAGKEKGNNTDTANAAAADADVGSGVNQETGSLTHSLISHVALILSFSHFRDPCHFPASPYLVM
jgi:hypothetical protein